jgi:hypothetical protein
MKISQHRTLLTLALVVAIMTMASVAMAQPGPAEGQQGAQGDNGARRGGEMMMRMQQQTPPAIAVADGAVFLFVRNTLYKFDADTLELLAQAQLPMPQRPAGPQQ